MTKNTRIGFLLMLCAMPVSCSSAGDEDTTSVNKDEVGRPAACGLASEPACVEDLCRKQDCGGPNSVLDEDGCYRPSCETDPCDAGQECRETEYAPVSCSGVLEDGTCECGNLLVVVPTKMCFPVVGEAGRPTACGWPSACLEDLCRNNDCGGPDSAFDEDGCYRPTCETTACEADQECREVQYVPVTFSGVLEDGSCTCGYNPIIVTTKMCFPVAGE